MAIRLKKKRRRKSRPSARPFVAFVTSTVVIALGGLYLLARTPDSAVCNSLAGVESGTPIALTLYMDLQCADCDRTERSLWAISRRWELPLTIRHYPLDPECNPRVSSEVHRRACAQAKAAICAEAEGAGRTFREKLFHAVTNTTPELVDLAVQEGLDRRRFDTCLSSGATAEHLRSDINAAVAKGVDSIPTLFVNGTRHVGALREHDLRCIVALDRRP